MRLELRLLISSSALQANQVPLFVVPRPAAACDGAGVGPPVQRRRGHVGRAAAAVPHHPQHRGRQEGLGRGVQHGPRRGGRARGGQGRHLLLVGRPQDREGEQSECVGGAVTRC